MQSLDSLIHRQAAVRSHDAYLSSPYDSVKHSTYFAVYDHVFSAHVGRGITFVEVGVLNGGSLFMWRALFGPDARIIGIDLNPEAKRWEAEGFEIHIGSQSDPAFWETFFAGVGPIDILLDDGGHTFEQQIITTDCVLPHVRDGGMLVVEDTHTSYLARFGGPSRHSFVSYAKNRVDGVNHRFEETKKAGKAFDDTVFGVRFYESFVVFEVNRALCAIESRRVHNGGVSFNAKDFRYADAPSLEAAGATSGLRAMLKNVPVAGAVLRKAAGAARRMRRALVNQKRNAALARYFRF